MGGRTDMQTSQEIDALIPPESDDEALSLLKPERDTNLFAAFFLSPLLWGGVLTVGFYCLIPYLPVQREFVIRYFCSHPLEYVTTTLFFIGMAILASKAVRLSAEHAALELDITGGSDLNRVVALFEKIEILEEKLLRLSAGLGRTHLVARIRDVCAYIKGHHSTESLEDHLKYIAELAAERLHRSYALVRTITWAVPILGFLGTVIGITIAIANVTPDQLDTSLSNVTGGLAVAFDTTALALGLSIILVFGSFLIERAEQSILADVEEFGIKRLTTLFPLSSQERGPLAEAEAHAARQLIDRTESLINWQMQLWEESLESMRKSWSATLVKQQHKLDQSLEEGMAATLADHAAQMAEVREEFLHTFKYVSGEIAENQAQQVDRLIQSISNSTEQWQSQLIASSETGNRLLQELNRQAEILLQITEQETELSRLQGVLVNNLDTVRAAETLDKTLHSLSAIVHLLSARAQTKAA